MGDESPDPAHSEGPETFVDERFGTFEKEPTGRGYSSTVEWNGTEIELSLVTIETGERLAGLSVAKELWDEQDTWTDRIQQYATDELLELKNVAWVESEADEVTAEEFKRRMELKAVSIERDSEFTFWHYDTDLFFGHRIKVGGTLAAGITEAYL